MHYIHTHATFLNLSNAPLFILQWIGRLCRPLTTSCNVEVGHKNLSQAQESTHAGKCARKKQTDAQLTGALRV